MQKFELKILKLCVVQEILKTKLNMSCHWNISSGKVACHAYVHLTACYEIWKTTVDYFKMLSCLLLNIITKD